MVVNSCVNGEMNGEAITQHTESTADIVCLTQLCYVPAAVLHESDAVFLLYHYQAVFMLQC